MAVAMTVGATRIQILHQAALSSSGDSEAIPSAGEEKAESESKPEVCVA